MLQRLQHNILELHTSDFRFCVIQTQLCTRDSMSHNCGVPGARKVRDRSDIQVSKKQDIYSSLNRKDSISWGASLAERWRDCAGTTSIETCVRNAMSSHSAHHLQVHLTQLSLFVNKCSLQPHSLIFTVRFAFLIACPFVCLFVLSFVLSLVGSFFFIQLASAR